MNEQETSNNERVTEAQAPQPTEENVENANNDEKYVLYADIMGFKERVMRTKHEDLKKELKKLRKERADSTHMVESALLRYALRSGEGGSLLFGDVDNLAVL